MRPGRHASPDRELSPRFYEAVRAAIERGQRSYILSRISGFPQPQMFSSLLHAKVVRATPTNVERLQKLADALGFPREDIFAADRDVSA